MKTLIYILSIMLIYHLFCLFIFTISPESGYLNIAGSEMMTIIGLIISSISGILVAYEIIEKLKL